jgi:hypothetical protein
MKRVYSITAEITIDVDSDHEWDEIYDAFTNQVCPGWQVQKLLLRILEEENLNDRGEVEYSTDSY